LANPVTAVLIVFRGADTWLEMGILLLAVLGMLTARERHGLQATLLAPPDDPILEGVVRMLAPLAVLTATYFLWLGTFSAGGAFQSGVVLGATGILLWLSRHPSIGALPEKWWKALMLCGFAFFTLAALTTLLVSEWMLQFPQAYKVVFVKVLEMAAAISIGACFVGLFVGQHPARNAFSQRRTGGAPRRGRRSMNVAQHEIYAFAAMLLFHFGLAALLWLRRTFCVKSSALMSCRQVSFCC
jgi:multisubunit Na+/H+ antiporter MnhB subunit